MRIKGTQKPSCSLCRFCSFKPDRKTITCNVKKSETSLKASCEKFSYDIFKYIPQDKQNLSKFSKEDFEI